MLPQAREESDRLELQSFIDTLKELHAQPYLVEESDATELVTGILKSSDCKSVVSAGLPEAARGPIEAACSGVAYSRVEELSERDAVPVISRADAGITWAEYGVVRDGALLEIVYDDAIKLASSLPSTHIAVMSSKRLLPDLEAAIRESGRIILSAPANRKPVISFISGPSKTGDIEMRLLYGVHGPHALHVLVLDWV